MNRSSTPSRTVVSVAVLLAAVFAITLVAGGAFGRGVDPSPAPSLAPSVPPSQAPATPSDPAPTPTPSGGVGDGPITVNLDDPTGHDVSVVVDDETGTLDRAISGKPGDGMSVRWFDAQVENLDAETLRVVWVGLPRDEDLLLAISGEAGDYQLRIVQSAPPANSDALGVDRVLVLHFDIEVSAADVEVSIEETASNG